MNVRKQWLLFLLSIIHKKKSLEDRHFCGVILCLPARNVWRIYLRFYEWLWGMWSLRDVTDRDINFIHSCRKTGWVIGGDLNLPPYSWSHNFTSAGSEIFNWQMIPLLKWAKYSFGLLLCEGLRHSLCPLTGIIHREVTRNSPLCLEFLVSNTPFPNRSWYINRSPQKRWREAPYKGLEWQEKGK